MPDRYGGGGDYSQTFAYLAQTYQNNLEQQAEAANARRESEQAAKDTEVFARYDAGKLSGSALLAYIRQRINQTAYDPKQQAEWKKALLEYTESINDASALAAFERSNDYNGYLDYLRGKLTASKGNPTKAAQIQQQINQLTDERDSKSVTRGAERIMLAIAKGDKTNADLLRFYRDAIKNTRKGSSIRDQVRGQITNLVQKVRADNLTLQRTQLDAKLSSGDINVNEWGRQLKRLAESSNLDQMDPNAYASWMADANKAINTVIDTGRLEEIDGMLQRKEITPQQAERMYYKEADRYRVVDPSLYNQIRNKGYELGHTPIPGQTPLPNPGVLGLPDGYTPNQTQAQPYSGGAEYTLKWISQLDGSEFAQVNCVMGASAMLAYAMGYREKGGGIISGGDIRYLTGDREMGTNLDQAEYALGRLGINGLRNFNDKHISFDEFKKRVGERGMPAVLMGVYNNMPAGLRPGYQLRRGHGIFIAAYDEKANKFLVMDPAYSKRSHPDYKGEWMDASVVRNFGWGPSFTDSTGTYSFNGQALFAPPGTIKGRLRVGDVTNRQSNVKLHYVSVDDPPVRRQTPKNWSGLNHSGFSPNQAVGHPATDKRGKPRVTSGRRAVDENTPDTVEEVQKALDESGERLDMILDMSEAYSKGADQFNGVRLSPDLMKALDEDTLDIYDRDIMYAQAAGLTDIIASRTKSRATLLADISARLTTEASDILKLGGGLQQQGNEAIAKGFTDAADALNKNVPAFGNAVNQGLTDAADQMQQRYEGVMARNAITKDRIINTAIRDARWDLDIAIDDPDPDAVWKKIESIRARLHRIKAGIDASNSNAAKTDDVGAPTVNRIDIITSLLDVISQPSDLPMPERIQQVQDAIAALGDDEKLPTTKDDGSPDKPGSDLGELAWNILVQRNAQDAVDRGEAAVVVDGQTGKRGVVSVAPTLDPMTGAEVMVPIPPQGRQMTQVPVETPTGVQMQTVLLGQTSMGLQYLVPVKPTAELQKQGWRAGVPLNEDQIAALEGNGQLLQAIQSGQLQAQDYMVPMVRMPDQRVNGKVTPGQTFMQDIETGNWFTGGLDVLAKDFGAHAGRFIGMNPNLTPQFNYRPNASAWMYPTPFEGSRKKIQDAVDQGIVPVPQTYGRGDDGNISDDPNDAARFYSPWDPMDTVWNQGGAQVQREDPGVRADRIEGAIRQARELIRQRSLQQTQDYNSTERPPRPEDLGLTESQGYDPFVVSRPEPIPVPEPRIGQNGPVGTAGPQGPIQQQPRIPSPVTGKPGANGFGPQGGATDELAEMAKRLGVKVNAGTPKGPVGPTYRTPSPRNVQQQPKPKQSSLPKIGSSVMVGGTRIDVPGSKPQSKPAPGFKIPSAPKVGGGSAAQATLDRVKREVTSPTQTGNY